MTEKRVTSRMRVALGLGVGGAGHERPRSGADRSVQRVAIVVTAVIAALMLRDLIEALSRPDVRAVYGAKDYTYYIDITRRWLAGGPFYEPWQLDGPYPFMSTPLPGHVNSGAHHPPVALWIFVPFTLLPAGLRWAIPLARGRGALATATRPARVAHPRTVPLVAPVLRPDLQRKPRDVGVRGALDWGRVGRAGCVRVAEAQPLPVRPLGSATTPLVALPRAVRSSVPAVWDHVGRLGHRHLRTRRAQPYSVRLRRSPDDASAHRLVRAP